MLSECFKRTKVWNCNADTEVISSVSNISVVIQKIVIDFTLFLNIFIYENLCLNIFHRKLYEIIYKGRSMISFSFFAIYPVNEIDVSQTKLCKVYPSKKILLNNKRGKNCTRQIPSRLTITNQINRNSHIYKVHPSQLFENPFDLL